MRELRLIDNMRELRITNGYSQQFVGDQIHITRQTYSLYETGKRIPDMETVCVLADLYHVSVDLLLYADLSTDIEKISDAPSSEHLAITGENSAIPLNGPDTRMLVNYKSLPPELQEEMRDYVLFKKKRWEAKQNSNH